MFYFNFIILFSIFRLLNLTMTDKGATRGSLFAGMNLGGIKRVSSKTSACNTGDLKEQVKASATSSKGTM